MSSTTVASELVDDSDPRVQYQPGWIWDQGVAELDATRHGASTAGLRAWLTFTGTGVRVIGTLGSSDTFGQPKTTYLVDGKVAGTYSAPLTPSGETQYNVTFFSARNLSPGSHIVLINNTDGTAPNTFWLDYFLVDPIPGSSASSGAPSPTLVSDPVASDSTAGLSSGITSTPSVSAPAGVAQTSAPSNNVGSGSSSASHSNAGVIAGATVGGVAGLAILALLFFFLRRRRRPDTTEAGTVAPFAYSQDPFVSRELPPSSHQPSMRYSSNAGAPLSTGSAGHFSHRPATAPPSEIAPESVVSQSESYTPSASSGSALLAPVRRPASPPSPSGLSPAPHRPPPILEKSTTSIAPTTPSLGYTTTPGTGPESSYSSSAPQTPASPAFSSASATSPLVAPAALPPGAWHAPPDSHGRAHTLLRSLFSRGSRAVPDGSAAAAPRDVDSGLRLYDEVVLPPPYTQE